jgi:hypothetical protein
MKKLTLEEFRKLPIPDAVAYIDYWWFIGNLEPGYYQYVCERLGLSYADYSTLSYSRTLALVKDAKRALLDMYDYEVYGGKATHIERNVDDYIKK